MCIISATQIELLPGTGLRTVFVAVYILRMPRGLVVGSLTPPRPFTPSVLVDLIRKQLS